MVPDMHMTLFRFVDAGLTFKLEAPNETRTPTQWIVTIICAIRWIPPSLRELLRTGFFLCVFHFILILFSARPFPKSTVKNWLNFVSLVQTNLHMYPIQFFASLQFLLPYTYFVYFEVFFLCPSFCFFLLLMFFGVPVQLARFIEKWFKIRYWVFISFLGFVFCFVLLILNSHSDSFQCFFIFIIINPMFKLCIYNVIFIIHFKWYLLTSQLFAHIDLIPFIF